MGLKVGIRDVPNCPVVESSNLHGGDSGSIITKMVYGQSMSLRFASRLPGYHSKPHIHATEQLNYVTSGELSIYMFGKEYRLQPGDFLHVPKMTVHWAGNNGDGSCEMFETHTPPNLKHPEIREAAIGLFSQSEHVSTNDWSETIWLAESYASDESSFSVASEDDPYWITAHTIRPSEHIHMRSAGGLFSLFVHGFESNLMVATRPGGYHSKPHIHDCEQLNYLMEGRMWIFIDQDAFLLEPGDFLRVPAMVPHWAWNDGETECKLLEAHSPILDASGKSNAVALLPHEQSHLIREVGNFFVPPELATREQEMIRVYYGEGDNT